MKKKLNARFLVLGAIALTFIILAVSFYLFSDSSGNLIEQTMEKYITENVSAIATVFNTKLNDQLVMLESQVRYFNDIDLSDYNLMKDTILSTKGIGAFKNIGVANSTGSTINYNGKSSGNIMLTDYFKEAMTGKNAISEITYIDEDGDEVLVVAVPIVQNGKSVGVVYGTFTKDILDSLIDTVGFEARSSSFLLDNDGTILASSLGSDNLPADARNFKDIAQIDLNDGTEEVIFSFASGGMDMLAVKTPIGLHDWIFVTVIPEYVISEITESISVSVIKVVLSTVLAFLILLGSIVILFIQIKGVTAEKQRMSTELNVATKIQADMMPYNFPERGDLSLYATMTPAKEIGGDFYDFFFTDDDHLVMVMADVAGKGIPAALFMVNAKSIIRNITRSAKIPSKILEISNNILCENNNSGLFVTVWLGILTISTGELISANAGHEYPALKRSGGKFEILEGDNCPPLAAMEELEFEDSVITLGAGDGLFLYTDGVPEAKSVSGERFGLERMINVLNEDDGLDLVSTLTDMKNKIDEFNGDKDPFDDVTMMGLNYFGNAGNKV